MPKILNFDRFWAVFPHLCPNKLDIWDEERTMGPLPPAKFYIYRGNVSPLWGRKNIFGLLSRRNTGMAALHAGLPVISNSRDQDRSTFFSEAK